MEVPVERDVMVLHLTPCILIYTPPSTPLLFFLLYSPSTPPPPPPLLPSFTTSTTSSRCIVCEQCLPESYYQLEEQPYCRDHYYERTAHQCQKCSDYITGPTMVGGCPFSGYRSGNETMVAMSHSQTMSYLQVWEWDCGNVLFPNYVLVCRSGNETTMGGLSFILW